MLEDSSGTDSRAIDKRIQLFEFSNLQHRLDQAQAVWKRIVPGEGNSLLTIVPLH